MHSNISFSRCIVQRNYRNSLRSSSFGKLNYPQWYLFSTFTSKFSNYSIYTKICILNIKYPISIKIHVFFRKTIQIVFSNDPSAGSPTETLLRLLLPLNKEVHIYFWFNFLNNPRISPLYSIGRSDGRCVQRAGTYSTYVNDIILQGIPRS